MEVWYLHGVFALLCRDVGTASCGRPGDVLVDRARRLSPTATTGAQERDRRERCKQCAPGALLGCREVEHRSVEAILGRRVAA